MEPTGVGTSRMTTGSKCWKIGPPKLFSFEILSWRTESSTHDIPNDVLGEMPSMIILTIERKLRNYFPWNRNLGLQQRIVVSVPWNAGTISWPKWHLNFPEVCISVLINTGVPPYVDPHEGDKLMHYWSWLKVKWHIALNKVNPFVVTATAFIPTDSFSLEISFLETKCPVTRSEPKLHIK